MRQTFSTRKWLLPALLSFWLGLGAVAQTANSGVSLSAYTRQSAFQKIGNRSRLLHNRFVERLKGAGKAGPVCGSLLKRISAAGNGVPAAKRNNVKLATTAGGAEIWGYVDGADSWYDMYGDKTAFPQGLYQFAAGSNSYSPLFEMTGVDLNGGAAIFDNVFHGISYAVDWNTYDFIIKYYEYNTTDWTPTANNGKPVPDNYLEMMAACTAVDPTDGNRVYGCVSNSDLTSSADYLLATIDYSSLSYQEVAELKAPYAAMAFDKNGQLYAIDGNGTLLKVDKATGAETVVGLTGLKPSSNFMSAAFDLNANTLYWAATTKDGASGIYQVDTATGTATAVSAFGDSENITFLYVKSQLGDAVPADAADFSASFEGDATSGTLSFAVPAKTYGGQALTGDVEYSVSDNGAVIAEGTAAPGQKVNLAVTAAAGSHKYTVVLSNAAGAGNAVQTTAWVGRDASKPVGNLVLAITGGVASLHWQTPDGGAHDGNVDLSALRYNVVRMPDNVVVASGQSGTSFSETLPDTPYTYYYYKVMADNNGTLSEQQTSNIECTGTPLVPPYEKTFSTLESTYTYVVVDNNNDGVTWGYADGEMAYMSMKTQLDGDDWIVSPPFHLKNDRQYKVQFNASCYSESDVEHFGVAIGADSEPDINNYNVLMADTAVHSTVPVPVVVTTSVKTEGDYRFAVKAVGNTGLAQFVNSFAVAEGSRFSAPDSVRDMVVTPDATGALKAMVALTTPSATVGGSSLSGPMDVKLYRGSVSASTLVKTVAGVAPGRRVEIEDTPLVGGITAYYAVASNAYGDGLAAGASAYVGFDTPLAPSAVTLKDNLDGTATISWTSPSGKGIHGGAVDMEHLEYNIYSVNDGTPSLLKSGVTGNSYNLGDVTDNGEQKLTFYAMKSVANDLQSQYATSTLLMTGSPYTLPFNESFAGGNGSRYWASNVVSGNSDEGFGYTTLFAADDDGGSAFYNTSAAEGEAVLTSGKISLSGAAYPYVYFSYYALPGEDIKLKLLAYSNGGAADTLKTIDYSTLSGLDGWRKVMVDLSQYTSSKYVLVGFDAAISGSQYPVLIDAVKVRDDYQYDLETSIAAPSKVKAGDEITVMVNVNNAGTKTTGAYDVNLMADGKVVGTQRGGSLGVNVDRYHTFVYRVPVTCGETLKVQGQVVSDFDMDDTNDASDVKAIAVYQPEYPAVSDLKADAAGEGVRLSWSSAVGMRNEVTDGFESYDSFAIDNVGSWTLVDVDKADTYSVSGTSYANANGKFAYIVFNPEAIDATNASILPHGGSQYMASMASPAADTPDGHNDDWLVSPELSGNAQSVSFWVKSLNDTYGLEQYEILYSTTGKNTSDFKLLSSATAPADAWSKVTADLPDGAKYFAIRCVSEERFMFMVDDVTYEGLPLEVNGYNVYRDGECIATLSAAATSYTDAAGSGSGVYHVSVIYAVGESALSNGASVGTAGIGTLDGQGVAVVAADGRISVSHADGRKVTVSRVDGAEVAVFSGRDRVECAVASGVYLVRVGSKTYKITVF